MNRRTILIRMRQGLKISAWGEEGRKEEERKRLKEFIPAAQKNVEGRMGNFLSKRSENSLNQHIKLKHVELWEDIKKEAKL